MISFEKEICPICKDKLYYSLNGKYLHIPTWLCTNSQYSHDEYLVIKDLREVQQVKFDEEGWIISSFDDGTYIYSLMIANKPLLATSRIIIDKNTDRKQLINKIKLLLTLK